MKQGKVWGDTKELIYEVVENFKKEWGALNPEVNAGIEFTVNYIQKQQAQLKITRKEIEDCFTWEYTFKNKTSTPMEMVVILLEHKGIEVVA